MAHPHFGSWWPDEGVWFSHWDTLGKNERRAVVVTAAGVAIWVKEPAAAVWQDGAV
jgi:hypothetical protein